jgi:hypothetical protein
MLECSNILPRKALRNLASDQTVSTYNHLPPIGFLDKNQQGFLDALQDFSFLGKKNKSPIS